MVNIKKMRLPFSAEYTRLAELIHESDVWMNWSTALSWCEDKDPIHHALREARGGAACKNQAFIPDDTRAETIGFRPAFEADTDIPDGQITIVGSLFMNGMPVKVPTGLTDTTEYIPGARLELRMAVEDENYWMSAIRAGDVLIADRVMLKNITWDECKGEIHNYESLPMRLPSSAEWKKTMTATGNDNRLLHWKDMYFWCQEMCRETSEAHVNGCSPWCCPDSIPANTRRRNIGFRPVVETGEDLRDGQSAIMGTLFMNGEPVLVSGDPTADGVIEKYISGASLEFRSPAINKPGYQVRGIKVGDVMIADRVLLRDISWEDAESNIANHAAPAEKAPLTIKDVRLPSSEEWDRMIDVTFGVNSRIHWSGTFSWCLDECADNHDRRVTRGCYAGRYADAYKSESRLVSVGFRPVFDIENPKSIPEGEIVTVGTLYMDGRPVPTNHNGDMKLPAYIPGARLELREPAEDPKYHVKAIRAGDVLIGDRVLLSQISWDDLANLGFCGSKNLKGETIMKDTTIIYLGNADDAYTIACSKQNGKKVLNFLTKRYPEWTKEYEGRELSLWNKLLDTVEVMKDLLEDDNLELLSKGNVAAIRLRDEVYGDSVVLCSRENEERVKAFLLKRYPKWSGNCIGKTGLTPWNDVEDAVRDMKELLGDGNLEFQPSCRDIPIPTDPIKN